MGALVIDVAIAYIIKLVVRFFRISRSGRWSAVKAIVDSASVGGGYVWNCPTAEIAYTYDYDGQTYSGIETIPYLMESVAKATAHRFRTGEVVTIRVNPFEPQQSLLKQAEQIGATWV